MKVFFRFYIKKIYFNLEGIEDNGEENQYPESHHPKYRLKKKTSHESNYKGIEKLIRL